MVSQCFGAAELKPRVDISDEVEEILNRVTGKGASLRCWHGLTFQWLFWIGCTPSMYYLRLQIGLQKSERLRGKPRTLREWVSSCLTCADQLGLSPVFTAGHIYYTRTRCDSRRGDNVEERSARLGAKGAGSLGVVQEEAARVHAE